MTRGEASGGESGAGVVRVRIDKWLWAARFYKTRSLAADAVDAGQVRVAGERVKPAHAMRVGERIHVRKAGLVFEVDVIALSDRRRGASEAATLYFETAESRAARDAETLRRRTVAPSDAQTAGRPTKRDRRKLEDFLNEP